jgi:large subunit ribosomal protein L2
MIINRIINRPDFLWSGRPVKHLTISHRVSAGRNNLGRITSFHRGGGAKKRFRFIDFKRNLFDIPAIVRRIEYDPCRSSFIALVCYQNGVLSYVCAPTGLRSGDFILSSRKNNIPLDVGNSVPLFKVSPGVAISNIELKPFFGSCFSRSAGCFSVLLRHLDDDFSIIRLSSGEERIVSSFSLCTVGQVSNEDSRYDQFGKAGVSRLLGRRPVVRGVAMNPIDHPHGGGQGKSTAGRHPVSPWGVLTKGFRTVKTRSLLILKPRFK